MAHYTLIARINTGDGKFPFVTVKLSKNHRPIPIEGATYYLRPRSSGKRTPIKIGKDATVAHTALMRMANGQPLECIAALHAAPPSSIPTAAPRTRVAEAAQEYIERSKQKSHKTYLGYRTTVNLFVASCKKTYFDQICRDDMLDFLHELRTRPSRETGKPIGESTVFNYFLKTMVFLNDRCIGKRVTREDWVQKKDWPVNVDKRNKNKKYATYTEQEVAAMIQVADTVEEALTRFLVGTGFRIGEAAVAQWMDINWFSHLPRHRRWTNISTGSSTLSSTERTRRVTWYEQHLGILPVPTSYGETGWQQGLAGAGQILTKPARWKRRGQNTASNTGWTSKEKSPRGSREPAHIDDRSKAGPFAQIRRMCKSRGRWTAEA